MKRFGRYNSDFTNLFECYSQVGTVTERKFPSTSIGIDGASSGISFPGAEFIKVFIQQAGRGADLTHLAKISSIDSDDGDGGSIITGVEGDKQLHIVTTKDNAQVRVVGSAGDIENEFVTITPIRYDDKNKEIVIIQVEEV